VKLAITLPLALWGIASHALPYALDAPRRRRHAPHGRGGGHRQDGGRARALSALLGARGLAREAVIAGGSGRSVVFLLLLAAPPGLIALALAGARLERVARRRAPSAASSSIAACTPILIAERRMAS